MSGHCIWMWRHQTEQVFLFLYFCHKRRSSFCFFWGIKRFKENLIFVICSKFWLRLDFLHSSCNVISRAAVKALLLFKISHTKMVKNFFLTCTFSQHQHTQKTNFLWDNWKFCTHIELNARLLDIRMY